MKRSSLIYAIIITFIVTNLLTVVLYTYLPFEKICSDRIHQLENILENSYIGEFDKQKAEEDAIKVILSSTKDKYAAFYDEEASKELLQVLDGYYCGIGVEVAVNHDENILEIVSVYKDSPAEKGGLRAGDVIVSIDSTTYDGTMLAEASAYLKCNEEELKVKPDVIICVKRNNELKNIKVTREKIDYYKITSFVKDKILYIRYSGFSQRSFKEFESIIKNTDESDLKGIIIDLRDNPGGELGSSIDMCDLFLDNGLIMYTLDKKENKKEYFADEYSFNAPMVVIVNKSTASAAEIFAGSMKGRNRATIIGEKTFGKGVSQSLIEFTGPEKGTVKITTKKNYTPDGKWLNEAVTPDVAVDDKANFTNIEEDSAYLTAVKILKQ